MQFSEALHTLNEKLKVRPLLLIAFALLSCFFTYWPSLNGAPIWDDIVLWFHNPIVKTDFRYSQIFIDGYTWPLSVLFQKWSYHRWHEHYLFYHLSNLTIHSINSLLVLKIAKDLKWQRPLWIFLLFLLHPASVLAVAWMIQVKTLICFFFAALTVLAFLRQNQNLTFYWLALASFALSLCAKSSSVTLPLLLLPLLSSKSPWERSTRIAPFLLLSVLASVKLLSSPINTVAETVVPAHVVLQTQASFSPLDLASIARLGQVFKSTGYYFSQAYFPWRIQPIKGAGSFNWNLADILRFTIFSGLVFWGYRRKLLPLLGAGFILLAPFLGFISAPYARVSWVSDQHLYLALPVFLAFGMQVANWPRLILLGLTVVYVWLTNDASGFFSDEITFYTRSLRLSPTNIVLSNNLTVTYMGNGQLPEALLTLNSVDFQAALHPEIRRDPYYNNFLELKAAVLAFKSQSEKSSPSLPR